MKTMTEINAAIAKISKTGQAFDKLVHETAVSVAEHFAEHKDTGLVNRLFLAMPKGARGNALAAWLLKYVAVQVNTNAQTKKEQPFVSAKDAAGKWTKETDALAGAQDPWYNHKPEKPVDIEFDMLSMVKAMLRKLEASTKLEHYDKEQEQALKALAKSVGISESDVPRKLAAKVEAPDAIV